MGQDIYAVGQVIADLGELAKSWEWARATGKLERERGNLKSQRTIPIGGKEYNRSNLEANVV